MQLDGGHAREREEVESDATHHFVLWQLFHLGMAAMAHHERHRQPGWHSEGCERVEGMTQTRVLHGHNGWRAARQKSAGERHRLALTRRRNAPPAQTNADRLEQPAQV